MSNWFDACKEKVKSNEKIESILKDFKKNLITDEYLIDSIIEKFGEYFLSDDGK